MSRGATARRVLALASGLLVFGCGLSAVGTGAPATTDGGSTTEGGPGPGDAAGTADGGTPPGDGAVDYTMRVTTGLYALYEFEENAGATARDRMPAAYDLTIDDTSKVTWHPHYLEIKDSTSLSNAATFTKLVTQGQATHEVTVEAWVAITGVESGDYGRLVSLIKDADERDIDMGLRGTSWWAALKSASTQIEKGPAAAALTHLVLTRTASDQTLRMYVDGSLFASAAGAGDPATFVGYRMFVANSWNGDRGVTGALHLLAFYNRALTPAEIAKNHAAGADPKN